MFQSFDVTGGPPVGRRNLPKLRARLAAAGLDGFIVPHEDEYQNEYLPAANERLAWATGFTGSAGAALVLTDKALLFVDGRYTVQAREQADPKLFELRDLMEEGIAGWLAAHGPAEATIGYDPRLHAPDSVAKLEAAARARRITLTPLSDNPIDAAWTDRPAQPTASLVTHPLKYAGENHADKRTRLGERLATQGLDAALITDPASVAWLLNVRGGDLSHTPAPLSSAVLYADGRTSLYINPEKLTPQVSKHLGNAVDVRDEQTIETGLGDLAGAKVAVDPALSAAWYFQALDRAGAHIERQRDPCALPRARKNPTEVEGARQAHHRDGVVVTEFLHWLSDEAPTGDLDEIGAAQKLEQMRTAGGGLKDLSFDTISGAGPNGALPHYRVNTKSNRKLKRGQLYLVDSGGQYVDGTTDITRTIAVGRPRREMRERYTLVLKGHIALSAVRFPGGTTGTHLDAFARQFLWNAGFDYDHGTGHGVGSFLAVHEGPQRIAKVLNSTPLQTGMIVSNEPGYYKEGAYGVRIENLQVVSPANDIDGGERPMHDFETLTLAPLDRTLIVRQMLTPTERAWVNAYHARVWSELGGKVTNDANAWLEECCAPI